MTVLDPYANGPDPDPDNEDYYEVPWEIAMQWANAMMASAPPVEPVVKHAQHDQKTHGHRGGGRSKPVGEVAAKVLEGIKREGGYSLRMGTGIVPHTGFMVARGVKAEETDLGSVEQVTARDVAGYIKQHKPVLAKDGNYLGGWVDDRGHVVMDVSQRVMDRGRAITLGKERGQDAIYDVVNHTDIVTKAQGHPVRFFLDWTKDPEELLLEIQAIAREAGWMSDDDGAP